MITILSQKHLTHDAAGRDVSIMYISLSSSADLPTKYDIPGIAIHEGSRAWDISTGKMYGFLESGGWQEQKVVINPMVLKGRVNSVSDLPSTAEPGWVYFVGAATDTNLQEYMYTESGNWDPIGYISITVDSQMSDSSENPVQNKVITSALSGKVDVVSGKGLSTEDYTTDEKTKLGGIEANANNYSLPAATTSSLGGVKVGTGLSINDSDELNVAADAALSSSSENPVQNKVITAALSGKADGSTLTPMTEQEYEALVTKTEPLYFIYNP